ncbi:MAG: hypothetical protein ACE144_17700 [Thermodesulfobacteriota bacterium]
MRTKLAKRTIPFALILLVLSVKTLCALEDPWVDVRNYQSINAAVTAIGSTQTTLLVPNTQTLTNSLTIPANIHLVILKGGSIAKASNYTLTIRGPFKPGRYRVFSGFSSEDVTFEQGLVERVIPEWWGENTTPGTTDMSGEIGCAINSLPNGGVVQFSEGIYLVTSSITLPQNIPLRLRGVGSTYNAGKGTILKADLASGFLFSLTNNIFDISLEDFAINGNSTADGAISYSGNYGFGWFIKNVHVYYFAKNGIHAVDIQDPSHIHATNLTIAGITNGTCLRIRANTLNTGVMTFTNCEFGVGYESKYGLEIAEPGNATDSINFVGCLFSNSTNNANITGRGLNFIGNHFEMDTASGVHVNINGGQNQTWIGNTFGGNGKSIKGIYLNGAAYTDNIMMDNNQFIDLNASGNCVEIANDSDIVTGTILVGYIHRGVTTPARLSDPGYKTRNLYSNLRTWEYADSLADDGVLGIPYPQSGGWGFAQAGNNEAYALFSFSNSGAVTLISNSGNTVTTDTDNKFCIVNAGGYLNIKNRLGSPMTVKVKIHYN